MLHEVCAIGRKEPSLAPRLHCHEARSRLAQSHTQGTLLLPLPRPVFIRPVFVRPRCWTRWSASASRWRAAAQGRLGCRFGSTCG